MSNSAPNVNNSTAIAYTGAVTIIDVIGNSTDSDNDTLSVISASASYGSVAINADGTLSYTSNQSASSTDTITYTISDGNGAGSTASVEIYPALIEVRGVELVTKKRVSLDEYGEDYSGGETGKLVKFELWVDASNLSTINSSASEILGYQFDMDFDGSEVGVFDYSLISGSNIGFNSSNTENSGITFNSSSGAVAIASSTAIVDTSTTNDGPPSFIGSEKLIGTFYVTPVSDIETLKVTLKDVLIVTDAGSIESDDYISNLEVSSVDATIQTDEHSYLNNITLHYFKDGTDTGVSTLVEGGDIVFDQSIEFDTVRLSDSSAYSMGVQADDAVALLKHIVFPETDLLVSGSTAWHAADVNNNGSVQADDAVAILKHIVFPETDIIEDFDLINNLTGERVTSLEMGSAETGSWSIVANGDVNLSGGFVSDFVVTKPTANNDTASTEEDTAVVINVLVNDVNASSVVSATANNGTVTINPDGTLNYQGNQDFNGTDTITYIVDDGSGGIDTGAVTVSVSSVNDDPNAANDTGLTDEDVLVNISALTNDTDPDGDTISLTSATATNGTVAINADGTLTYQGNQDFNGIDVITYTIDDDNGGTDTATINVTVNAVNDQTTVTNSTATVDEDNSIVIDLLANANDIDGDALVVTSASAANGSIDTDGNYTPNTNFNGTDTITYTVNDSEEATVIVTVNAVNDAPTLTSSMSSHTSILTVDADSVYTHNTSMHFNDVEDGNTGGSYSVSGNPAWMTIDTSTGTLSGAPISTDVGDSVITVTYADTSGISVSDTYTLTVNSADLSGVATDGPLQQALVFFDMNANDILDVGEVSDITDINGFYTLEGVTSADLATGTLVAKSITAEDNMVDDLGNGIVTKDTISGAIVENIIMRASSDASVISPLTTLVKEGIDNDDLLEVFGLERGKFDIKHYNPFDSKHKDIDGNMNLDAVNFEKVVTQLYTSVNAISESISVSSINAITGLEEIDSDEVYSLAINELVSDVRTEANKRIATREAKKIADEKKQELDSIDNEIAFLPYGSNEYMQKLSEREVKRIEKEQKEQEHLNHKNSEKNHDFGDEALIQRIAENTAQKANFMVKEKRYKKDHDKDENDHDLYEDYMEEVESFYQTGIEKLEDFYSASADNTYITNLVTEIKGINLEIENLGNFNNMLEDNVLRRGSEHFVNQIKHLTKNNRHDFKDNNEDPELIFDIENDTISTGDIYTYDTSQHFLDTDIGDTLTYSAKAKIQGDSWWAVKGDLPAWLSIDPNTGILSGTPESNDIGDLKIRVTARDSYGEKESDKFVLTVIEGGTSDPYNSTPTLTSSMSDHTSILTVDADSVYTHNTSMHFNDVEDGNTGGSYSVSGNPAWMTIDTSTGTLSGTPASTDAGATNITVTYTDLAGASVSDSYTLTVNTVVSDAPIFDMNDQLIQLRNMESITKAQASIDEYGADYTGGDIDTLIKYEMWIDASALSALNPSASEIRGYQFDMDVDATQVGAFDFSMIAGDNFGFYAANTANSSITLNSETGDVAMASSTAIVDINAANDGPPFFVGGEKLIGTFYVSPIDATATSVDMAIDSMMVVTDVGNIVQDGYIVSAVENPNTMPVANDDTAITDEDTTAAIDVLSNDTDDDGDSLNITSAIATNGTVTINGDGTLVYQGNQGFNGVDTITYTIDDSNGGTDTATVTVIVNVATDTSSNQLIQLRNMESITKAQASIDEYGADYTGGDIDTLIKYEMWIDASALSALNPSASEIRGYQFDMDVDATQVGAFDFSMIAGDNFGFYAANTANSSITLNSETGDVAMASSTAIVDINAANDGPPFFVGGEKLIGTFYVSPIDATATSVDMAIDSMMVVTDVDNIVQDDYIYTSVDIV